MKKSTLLLFCIITMILTNVHSQSLFPKLKPQEGLTSKNSSVEVVKNHIDRCLKSQRTQAGLKSTTVDTPTLDSVLIENNQFDDTEYEAYRFKYDEKGLNTYFMDDYYAPANNEVHNYYNENYFYNENGLMDYRTYESGDSESGLVETQKVKYSYNDVKLVDTIFYMDLSSNLTVEYYGIMEYNELNQVSSTVIWYEPDGMDRVKLMQEDYYYNSSNSQVENIKNYVNSDGANLIPNLSTSFSYSGDLLSQVSQTTYSENGEISDVYEQSFTYNENNIPTEWHHAVIYDSEVVQELNYILTYENDEKVIGPIIFDEQIDLNMLDFGRLSKMNMFEKIDGDWKDVGLLNCYYSDSIYYIASIPTTPKISRLNIYPNPANSMISVDVQSDEPCEVIFYDVTGKRVMQSSYSTQNIDITNLKNGYYLVQVQSNGKLLGSSKFLKN